MINTSTVTWRLDATPPPCLQVAPSNRISKTEGVGRKKYTSAQYAVILDIKVGE